VSYRVRYKGDQGDRHVKYARQRGHGPICIFPNRQKARRWCQKHRFEYEGLEIEDSDDKVEKFVWKGYT